jgi:putative CocE/NonD family hydrolase
MQFPDVLGRVFRVGLSAGSLLCLRYDPALAQSDPQPRDSDFGQYAPDPQFTATQTTSLYVPMRDGVRLAVSVVRPAVNGAPAPGRFPVLWQHSLGIAAAGTDVGPLGDDARNRGYRGVPTLARHGYVIVQVARRGQGPSFGRRRGYNDRMEAYDAYDVIDWLAAQPWSNGMIGVYGCSNTGDASMHAVTAGNPHLKAAWAGCFSWEKYDGFLRGGIFANWGTGPTRTVEQDMQSTPVQGDESKTLLRQAAEEHQGAFPLADMWAALPYRDSFAEATQTRFWYEGSVATYLAQLNRSGTAVYVQGGWRDDLRGQGLVTFANLTAVPRHIVIGPWDHCGNGDFDLTSEVHRFFDHHLKGMDAGMSKQAPIHYYTVNAAPTQAWRAADAWPPPNAPPVDHFLRGGRLVAAASKGASKGTQFTVRYDVDCAGIARRADGLLTGAPPCPLAHAGPHFATEPLKADVEVTGDAVADLWISSSTPDANVFAYLEDVAPDGKVTPVTDARLKASLRKVSRPKYENFGLPWHRSHAEDAAPLKAGEPAQLTFAFLPTSYVFKAGHRMQVSIAGADYRERDRTPVSPAPLLTIHDDATHASRVRLPTLSQTK